MKILNLNQNKVSYKWFEISPQYGDRNINSENFVKSIMSLYDGVQNRVKFDFKNRDINLEQQGKMMFASSYSKEEVTFKMCIPIDMEKYFKSKVIELWPKCCLRDVTIAMGKEYKVIFETNLRYDDVLALSVNKKDNEPLNSLLAASELMQNDDLLDIIVNIVPMNQNGWRKRCENTKQRIRDKENIEKLELTQGNVLNKFGKGLLIVDKVLSTFYMTLFNTLTPSKNITESDNKKHEEEMYKKLYESMNRTELKDQSYDTRQKETDTIYSVQVLFCCNSVVEKKAMTIANAFCNGLRSIEANNQFVFKRINTKGINFKNTYITYIPNSKKEVPAVRVSDMKLGARELTNFVQMPGSTLIDAYKNIRKNDRLPSGVPEDLQNGDVYLGSNRFRNAYNSTYITTHDEYSSMLMLVIGPPRCGKTTLFQNMAKDYIRTGQSVLYLDFIQQCEVSDEIASVIPPEKVLKINCGSFDNLQAFMFNELDFKDTDTAKQKWSCIKEMTNLLIDLLDTINSDSDETRARMKKYLKSACAISFSYHGSFKDAMDIMQKHVTRKKRITAASLDDDLAPLLEQSIINLAELDEYDKAGKSIIGTKTHLISGIMNRIDSLSDNAYMEDMLYKHPKDNINLIDEIQKGMFIAIQVPESKYLNNALKDMICLYWVNKMLMCVKKREEIIPKEQRIKVSLIIDEVYQLKTVQKKLEEQILQLPKFRLKPIVSVHHLEQVPIIKKETMASNPDTIVISRSKEENVKSIIKWFEPYEIKDILELPEYSALTLLKDNKGEPHVVKVKLPGLIVKK